MLITLYVYTRKSIYNIGILKGLSWGFLWGAFYYVLLQTQMSQHRTLQIKYVIYVCLFSSELSFFPKSWKIGLHINNREKGIFVIVVAVWHEETTWINKLNSMYPKSTSIILSCLKLFCRPISQFRFVSSVVFHWGDYQFLSHPLSLYVYIYIYIEAALFKKQWVILYMHITCAW